MTTAYDPRNRAWLLSQDVYNSMTRAERMKHRRKAVKAVRRKFDKIIGVMENGMAVDKHRIMDQWTNREPQGSCRVPDKRRYKWENVGFTQTGVDNENKA